MKILAWVWFVVVQLVMLFASLLGKLLLIPFCALKAWKPLPSPFDATRMIDLWSWGPLNMIYGNPEDGVSGAQALIWDSQGSERVGYMASSGARWRAYCWSAWRNSADNLKYVFAWKNGPFKVWANGHKAGWQEENGFKVPVAS